jgi:hypothetical protein
MQLIWKLRPPTSGPISECRLIEDSLRIGFEGHTEALHHFIDAAAATKTGTMLKASLYADGWTDADRIERRQRSLLTGDDAGKCSGMAWLSDDGRLGRRGLVDRRLAHPEVLAGAMERRQLGERRAGERRLNPE